MSQPCSWSDMAETSTPYPPSPTGRQPEITGHKNIPGTQQHQGPRAGHAPPATINSS
jgi:hypothetical protein